MEKIRKDFKKINRRFEQHMPFVVIGILIVFVVFMLTTSGKSSTTSVVPEASQVVDNLHNAVVTSLETVPNSVSSDAVSEVMSMIILSMIVILILVGGLKYLFKFDLYAEVKHFFTSPTLSIDIESKHQRGKKERQRKRNMNYYNRGHHNRNKSQASSVETPLFGSPEVFHISDNKYNYNEANAICKAFNSKLATYEQIEDAYNNGAEWCSYGWSDKGLALFPIQKTTYNKLQKIKGHENDCGRPGVNGGFIPNKNAKFGVNCYGVKPVISDIERRMMNDYDVFPKSDEEKRIEKKTEDYKQDLTKVIINPFNRKEWSA